MYGCFRGRAIPVSCEEQTHSHYGLADRTRDSQLGAAARRAERAATQTSERSDKLNNDIRVPKYTRLLSITPARTEPQVHADFQGSSNNFRPLQRKYDERVSTLYFVSEARDLRLPTLDQGWRITKEGGNAKEGHSHGRRRTKEGAKDWGRDVARIPLFALSRPARPLTTK